MLRKLPPYTTKMLYIETFSILKVSVEEYRTIELFSFIFLVAKQCSCNKTTIQVLFTNADYDFEVRACNISQISWKVWHVIIKFVNTSVSRIIVQTINKMSLSTLSRVHSLFSGYLSINNFFLKWVGSTEELFYFAHLTLN